jgi:hypothetical protein
MLWYVVGGIYMAITKEFLQSKWKYEAETGDLITIKTGKKPSTVRDIWGYWRSRQLRVKMCRIIWIYHNGDIPTDLQVDHIDGDVANDRIENLRLVTIRQNAQNRPRHREGHLLGAYPHSSKAGESLRWAGCIKIGKSTIQWIEDTAQLSHENYMLLNRLIENGCKDLNTLKKELYMFRIARGKSRLENYTPPAEWGLYNPDYQI